MSLRARLAAALGRGPRPEPEVVLTDAQWRARLDPEAYRVLRRAGTERPGSSRWEHPDPDRTGSFTCAGCGAELFRADDQYDSGSGWPSFTTPASDDAVDLRTDLAMLVPRREAVCRRCGGHLGHVFSDGPRSGPGATGQRWCINGAALEHPSGS